MKKSRPCAFRVCCGIRKSELLTFSNQLYLVGSATSYLAVLENGEFSALQLFDSVRPFSGPVSVLLRFSVFRPTAELVEYDDMIDDVFENSPKWLLFRNTSDSPNENGHTEAMAVDYNGHFDYKTPFGCESLEELDVMFTNTYFDRDPQTEAELDEYLRLHSNFRHVMLDMYGFAERLAEFEVRIDYDLETTLAAVSIARIS